ncbi:hypothetical protein [Gymnodinialimonas ulvae]|uniref:hypothetical protein n=1 Tax=Gymnodinialimonas ulvae TaxID=3126504 RepID=UPI0030AED46F
MNLRQHIKPLRPRRLVRDGSMVRAFRDTSMSGGCLEMLSRQARRAHGPSLFQKYSKKSPKHSAEILTNSFWPSAVRHMRVAPGQSLMAQVKGRTL